MANTNILRTELVDGKVLYPHLGYRIVLLAVPGCICRLIFITYKTDIPNKLSPEEECVDVVVLLMH
jgi:hypothetical protein